jgi:hypothetical protein
MLLPLKERRPPPLSGVGSGGIAWSLWPRRPALMARDAPAGA